MLKLVIIGGGNVAQHLAQEFADAADISLLQVFTRTVPSAGAFPESTPIIHHYHQLADADLYIVAVSDDAIAAVYGSLPFRARLTAHTSGMSPLHISQHNRSAVFYPLQTFTKGKDVDFTIIPLCIEAEEPADISVLEQAARAISSNVTITTEDQRKAMHVAAVFVNNFVNHLYTIGERICAAHHVNFDILKPLIAETAAKVRELRPQDAQTGPAKRSDTKTIDAHLAFLQDDSLKDIYSLLTRSIQDHVKKL